ncbi:hypothetical protein [Pleionea sp. CnH1-48]|uniref:hypothetical protein n=1 Tax=Pleionea sp. CnH1-48 TaxID=2954494 RepID=UPI00209713C4|nr:hypothetical protein [Pleionea sp. CnH1-48]MCO7225585.1 hypothetical protein [Pleionea sp. CnH1-48]
MKTIKAFILSLPFMFTSADSAAVNGQDVKLVHTNGSSFYQIGSKWYERGGAPNYSHKFVFTEYGRDQWSVYLFDSARNVRLQLDLWTKKVNYLGPNSSDWRTIFTISSSSPHQIALNGPTLYQHSNYGGYGVKLLEGSYTLNVLNARGIKNDDVSSVKVPSGFQLDTYEHNNFGGWKQSYVVNTSYVGSSKNDELSSVVVKAIDPIKNRAIKVYRHSIAPSFSNSEADRILGDASDILLTQDGSDDVACPVTMKRSGNVTTTTQGDGTLDARGDLSAYPDGITLVKAINYCSSLSPNIIGCASTPGKKAVFIRFTENQEGMVWAHEYGHNKGLSHRNGSNNLMDSYVGTSKRRVNQSECNSFINN